MFAEYGVLNYWTYLVGAIFIVLVPGPNTLFVLKNSVGRGVKGGYLAACGVFIGDAILMFLAYAGVATHPLRHSDLKRACGDGNGSSFWRYF